MDDYVYEYFNNYGYDIDVEYFVARFGEAILVFLSVVFIIMLVFYVLRSIALMTLGNKNNVPNAWLAWIPFGSDYVLGKLGFEAYDKKNPAFVWVLFGLSIANSFIGIYVLGVLLGLAYKVFSIWAHYNIFKAIKPNSAGILTIATVFGFGDIVLFCNRNTPVVAPLSGTPYQPNGYQPNQGYGYPTNGYQPNQGYGYQPNQGYGYQPNQAPTNVNSYQQNQMPNNVPTAPTNTMPNNVPPVPNNENKFCPSCGTIINNKNSHFCPSCGTKI